MCHRFFESDVNFVTVFIIRHQPIKFSLKYGQNYTTHNNKAAEGIPVRWRQFLTLFFRLFSIVYALLNASSRHSLRIGEICSRFYAYVLRCVRRTLRTARLRTVVPNNQIPPQIKFIWCDFTSFSVQLSAKLQLFPFPGDKFLYSKLIKSLQAQARSFNFTNF